MNATPGPIVSGKNFFPNPPLLCVKRIPALPVTSTNCTPACGPCEFVPAGVLDGFALLFGFALCASAMFGIRNEKLSSREQHAAAFCFKVSPGGRRGQHLEHPRRD